jgi:hypothetical protein
MLSKPPLNPDRLRRITGSFSWLDHRLIHDGYLARLAPAAQLLYFFLVLVGDKNGVSFYHYDKICTLLKLELDHYVRAREELIRLDLIAFDHGSFQVLQLPTTLSVRPSPRVASSRTRGPQPIGQILNHLVASNSQPTGGTRAV